RTSGSTSRPPCCLVGSPSSAQHRPPLWTDQSGPTDLWRTTSLAKYGKGAGTSVRCPSETAVLRCAGRLSSPRPGDITVRMLRSRFDASRWFAAARALVALRVAYRRIRLPRLTMGLGRTVVAASSVVVVAGLLLVQLDVAERLA